MPNTSLPQLQLPDPNGFVNALGAGMKLRRYQDEGDAAARKEEEALVQRNALSAYLSGDQSPESMRALGAVSPEGYLAIAKSKRETDKAAAQTGKANAEGVKLNLEAMREAVDAISANPSRENFTMVADWLDTQKVPTTILRKQFETSPDEQLPNLAQGLTLKVKEQEDLALKTRTADSQIQYRESMLGKPMVVTQPGGTFALSPETGYQPVPLDTGPSQMDADAAKAERAAEAKRVAAEYKASHPTPQIAAKAREKLQTLDVIDAQLGKVEDAFMGTKGPDGTRKPDGIQNSYSAGLGAGYLPTEGGRGFDAAVDGLRPFLRQLSRTPGEGAMSDYETRQAEALLPSRNDHESVTKQKIQQLRDIAKQIRAGMVVPASPAAPAGRPAPAMVPGADPGVTREQVEAEMRRRGLIVE